MFRFNEKAFNSEERRQWLLNISEVLLMLAKIETNISFMTTLASDKVRIHVSDESNKAMTNRTAIGSID